MNSLSGHGGTFSTHSPARVRNVVCDVGDDLDIEDGDNFQDVRIEVNATCMNLVSTSLHSLYCTMCVRSHYCVDFT